MAVLLLQASLTTTTATTTAFPFITRSPFPKKLKTMTVTNTTTTTTTTTIEGSRRNLPVLLFDIMDTIVRDPFYHDVPPFFGMSFDELVQQKHPTVWIEFEKGTIDELELAREFFKDGRPIDLEGLKNCMKKGYSYIDGVEELLNDLRQNEYEMHAFTNYPIWYKMIEEKLKISAYLSWTFCSCTMGKRKPDPDAYLEVVRQLKIDPGSCIFIDDRLINVEAANQLGIVGIHFKSTDLLREDLTQLGINIPARTGSQKL